MNFPEFRWNVSLEASRPPIHRSSCAALLATQLRAIALRDLRNVWKPSAALAKAARIPARRRPARCSHRSTTCEKHEALRPEKQYSRSQALTIACVSAFFRRFDENFRLPAVSPLRRMLSWDGKLISIDVNPKIRQIRPNCTNCFKLIHVSKWSDIPYFRVCVWAQKSSECQESPTSKFPNVSPYQKQFAWFVSFFVL